MADQRVPINIPVRGPLDTAMPIADRPVGTLVEAWDVSSRAWGPRRGSQAFTRVWEGPGTAALYDNITLNGTNNCRALGRCYEDKFRDLGTKFTVDLFFRLEDWAYATGLDEVGVYQFSAGGNGIISVGLYGDTQGANEKKLKVGITTTDSTGSADTIVTITGTATISTGATSAYNHHVRVVRDGATCTVYTDGVQDGQTTSLTATHPLLSNTGTQGDVVIGISNTSTISFKGRVFAAVLRDGAFSSAPITSEMPGNPMGSNVHHYILGRNIDLGGSNEHMFDAGPYGVHPRLIYNSGSDYTIASSNDEDFPAPAVVQGLRTWTTRTNKTATSVVAGGVLSTSITS